MGGGTAKILSEVVKNDVIEKRKHHINELLQSSYKSAQTYATVVIAGGYAVFFTTWSKVQIEFTIFFKYYSLLPMLFSLIIFIVWEIYKMIKSSIIMQKQAKVLSVNNELFEGELEKLIVKEQNYQTMNTKIWPGILVLTLIPAAFSTFILIFGCIKVVFEQHH